jgi:hypothetical protein
VRGRGVSIGIAFQKKLGVGLFGGEGFIMQKLEGDGLCFVHAGGTLHQLRARGRRDAARRHRLPRRAAAEVNYDIQFVGGIKTALFGGEGLFFATLHRARAACGCSRCPSPGWPAECSPPPCPPAARIAAKARSWGRSGAGSRAIVERPAPDPVPAGGVTVVTRARSPLR